MLLDCDEVLQWKSCKMKSPATRPVWKISGNGICGTTGGKAAGACSRAEFTPRSLRNIVGKESRLVVYIACFSR